MMAIAAWLDATALSHVLRDVAWIIPAVQSVHILGIGVVCVSSLMLVLRALGQRRVDRPWEEVAARFAPWLRRGLAVMALTGLLLIVGEPARQFGATSFWLKMALLILAVLMSLRLDAGQRSGRPAAPALAWGIVACWALIIFLGRAIAYDVEVWGGGA
ncbi:MAG: hypothetical protein RL026_1063 [Pseudomonadota bacterium]|jgi:hypothetical protein